MGDIHVYTLEAKRRDQTPAGVIDFETYDYGEARERAQNEGLMVIDNTYTFEDSELVDDFTGSDSCRYCGETVEEETPGGLWQIPNVDDADSRRYCDPASDHVHRV